MHNTPLLANERVLRNAVRRYERCWLPLLAAHGSSASGEATQGSGSLLAAPLDVAWVWWAHSLAPVPYRAVRLPPLLLQEDQPIAGHHQCKKLAPQRAHISCMLEMVRTPVFCDKDPCVTD